MNGTLLEVLERTEKGPKVRKAGFIPGIIYGGGIKGDRVVKFDSANLEATLKKSEGKKIQLKIGNVIEPGFIKEIQRNPVTERIIHIDIQVAREKDMMRMKFPVVFEGRDKLELKGLLLQIYVPDIVVYGMEKDLPEKIVFDVGNMKNGESVTASMLTLGQGVKLVDEPDEVLCSVTINKTNKVEEVSEQSETSESI